MEEVRIMISVIIPSIKEKIVTMDSIPSGHEIIIENIPNCSRARNRGAYESHGEYLFFLDDDISFPSELIEEVVEILGKHPLSLCCIVEFDDDKFYCVSRFMAMRRKVFMALGGFDERLAFMGEDIDFGYRAITSNISIIPIQKELIVHHGAKTSLSQHQINLLKNQLHVPYIQLKNMCLFKLDIFKAYFTSNPIKLLLRIIGTFLAIWKLCEGRLLT